MNAVTKINKGMEGFHGLWRNNIMIVYVFFLLLLFFKVVCLSYLCLKVVRRHDASVLFSIPASNKPHTSPDNCNAAVVLLLRKACIGKTSPATCTLLDKLVQDKMALFVYLHTGQEETVDVVVVVEQALARPCVLRTC